MQKRFNEYCEKVLCPLSSSVSNMMYYQSLPLCALDAVLSIQLHYSEQVVPKVKDFSRVCGISESLFETIPSIENQVKVSDLITRFRRQTSWDEYGLVSVIGNYKTAGSSNITKAGAFIQFVSILLNHKIETYQDFNGKSEEDRKTIEKELKSIKGQKVSVDYFFMLAGDENLIKVDRWLTRFAKEATGQQLLTNIQIVELFRKASIYLCEKYGNRFTPRYLDHLAWSYQRKNGYKLPLHNELTCDASSKKRSHTLNDGVYKLSEEDNVPARSTNDTIKYKYRIVYQNTIFYSFAGEDSRKAYCAVLSPNNLFQKGEAIKAMGLVLHTPKTQPHYLIKEYPKGQIDAALELLRQINSLFFK